MDPGSALILRGAESSGEGPFRQDNNLYYLTGINEPNTTLILFAERAATETQRAPGGVSGAKEILFWSPPQAGMTRGLRRVDDGESRQRRAGWKCDSDAGKTTQGGLWYRHDPRFPLGRESQ
jgi:hypothetical protein